MMIPCLIETFTFRSSQDERVAILCLGDLVLFRVGSICHIKLNIIFPAMRICFSAKIITTLDSSCDCLYSKQVGISIAARKYDFDAPAPVQVSDILNIQPVVKHSIPVCSEAKDLVETGKVQLAEV